MGFFNTLASAATKAKQSIDNAAENALKENWKKINRMNNVELVNYIKSKGRENLNNAIVKLAVVKLYQMDKHKATRAGDLLLTASQEEIQSFKTNILRFCKQDSIRLSTATELQDLKDYTQRIIDKYFSLL